MFFKTDELNPEIKYFDYRNHDNVPDVFKYIHLMHDLHSEEEVDEKLDQDVDIKELKSDKLLKDVLNFQRRTQNALFPTEKIFDTSMSEIKMIFDYMEQNSELKNKFFKKVLKRVNKM